MSSLPPDPSSAQPYEALLVVSFGGPEGSADVLPFLENVLRGKNVPRERMLEVAEHYKHFGGVSPINAQNRALIAALEVELRSHGIQLPIYWGNRNWHPLLRDTLRQMAADGARRAPGFFTSAYSSDSGCRQYRENIQQAQAEVGPAAPRIDKLRVFFNHPGFIETMIDRAGALAQIPETNRPATKIAFTAHSIPLAMAQGCRYEQQLHEASRLVAEGLVEMGLGHGDWQLVYQSRSGPPSQPWLGPDVCDWLKETAAAGTKHVVIVPIGFISDHVEVIYDLDTEARQTCDELGINMVRAATAGTHPRFVRMIRELIVERMATGADPSQPVDRPCGEMGPSHDVCPVDCCPSGRST